MARASRLLIRTGRTQLCLHQHCQQSGGVANASRYGQELFGHRCMVLCQFIETLADTVELVNFAQNRIKRHGYAPFPWGQDGTTSKDEQTSDDLLSQRT